MKKYILLVEDNRINARLMGEYLKRKGVDFIIAVDGESAVEVVKINKEISLVLMDIGLPEMTGDEAMRIIKQLRPGLPVVAQTAYTFDDSEDEYLKLGFDDFLTKPINFYMLDRILHKYDALMAI